VLRPPIGKSVNSKKGLEMKNHNQNQVMALNILSTDPYHIVISIAKKDLKYRSPSDTRYNGWRPIWFKRCTEWFGHYVLDEKMRTRYCEELIEHIISFPMISMLMGELKGLSRKRTFNSESGTVVYGYYETCNKARYRVGVDLIRWTILNPDCFSPQFLK
jgi:hypothetical protein